MPEDRAVIKDDIDAYELLKGGKAKADPDDSANAASLAVEQIGKAWPVMIAGERGVDIADLLFRDGRTE